MEENTTLLYNNIQYLNKLIKYLTILNNNFY